MELGDAWHYQNIRGENIGPKSLKELRVHWIQGHFKEDSMIWCKDLVDWVRVESHTALLNYLKETASRSDHYVQSTAPPAPPIRKAKPEVENSYTDNDHINGMHSIYGDDDDIYTSTDEEHGDFSGDEDSTRDEQPDLVQQDEIGSKRRLKHKGADSQISSPILSDDRLLDRGTKKSSKELNQEFEIFLKKKNFPPATQERLRKESAAHKRKILNEYTRDTHGSGNTDDNSIMEGEILKTVDRKLFGAHRLNTKTYFGILLKSGLQLYHHREDRKPAELIKLCKHSRVFSDPENNVPFTFIIIPKAGLKPDRQHMFHCSSPRDKNKWMENILRVASQTEEVDKSVKKTHAAYELTIDMMLGIRTTVSRLESKEEKKLLEASDMHDVEKQYFPSKGSLMTPGHKMSDFHFKVYSPLVFRKIRRKFKVDPTEFLLQCADSKYLEFTSNSKSGEFFFFSPNKKYMIKTVSQGECRCLRAFLPNYYRHVMSHRNTFLNRFYGLYRVQMKNNHTTWFLIMGSVFPSKLRISRLYDLKGSRYGRQASKKDKEKENCCYKDLDFINHGMKIEVGEELANKMKKQIQKDVEVLRQQKIIDYSMLVGVHFLDKKIIRHKHKNLTTSTTTSTSTSAPTTPVSASAPSTSLQSIASRNTESANNSPAGNTDSPENSSDLPSMSTAALSTRNNSSNPPSRNPSRNTSRNNSIRRAQNSQINVSEWKTNFNKLTTDLSKLMELSETELAQISEQEFIKTAGNNPIANSIYADLQRFKMRKGKDDNSLEDSVSNFMTTNINSTSMHHTGEMHTEIERSDHPPERRTYEEEESFANEYGGILSKKGDKLYFLGIIDTLIIYSLKKKLETTYKSTVLPVDSIAISVVPPDTYSARFSQFMEKNIC